MFARAVRGRRISQENEILRGVYPFGKFRADFEQSRRAQGDNTELTIQRSVPKSCGPIEEVFPMRAELTPQVTPQVALQVIRILHGS